MAGYRFEGVTPKAPTVPIAVSEREYPSFVEVMKDFGLNWREIAQGRQLPGGTAFAPAAIASNLCALAEDELILHHLLKLKGRTVVKMSDWDVMGSAFTDVTTAIEKLTQAGILPPFALVTSPALYARMHRILHNSGVLEIDQIRRLAEVYQSLTLGPKQALLVATGGENLDLAVGQDLITAYTGNQGMDHFFRVFETVVVRVKRAPAICCFE